MPVIKGTLRLPLEGPADVEVALEDISQADSCSIKIATAKLHNVEGSASFELEVPDSALSERRDYALTAFATGPGGGIRRAGTVAVHAWRPGQTGIQSLQLRAFPED